MALLIIFFFLIVVLYNRSKTDYVRAIILIFVAGKFILFKLGYYYTPTIFNVVYFSILYLCFIDGTIVKYRNLIGYSLGFYILYFVFFPALRGANVINILSSLISNKDAIVMLVFGLQLIELLRKKVIRHVRLCCFIKNLIVFEAFLAILQYIFPPISSFFVISSYFYGGQEFPLLDASFNDQTMHLCTGTLVTPSDLSIFLSLGVIILLLLSNSFNPTCFIKILLTFIALLICGVRAPLLACIIGVILFILFESKVSRKKEVIILIISLFLLISNLSIIGDIGLSTYKDQSREDPILRSISAIVVFSSNEDLENTTLGTTFIMMSYFLNNPIFGNLNHVLGRGYVLPSGNMLEDYSTTDAGLSFFLAEYGIIGLIVYLAPLFFFIRIVRNMYYIKRFVPLLIVLFFNSIVDAALLNGMFLCFIFISPFYLPKNIYKIENGYAK